MKTTLFFFSFWALMGLCGAYSISPDDYEVVSDFLCTTVEKYFDDETDCPIIDIHCGVRPPDKCPANSTERNDICLIYKCFLLSEISDKELPQFAKEMAQQALKSQDEVSEPEEKEEDHKHKDKEDRQGHSKKAHHPKKKGHRKSEKRDPTGKKRDHGVRDQKEERNSTKLEMGDRNPETFAPVLVAKNKNSRIKLISDVLRQAIKEGILDDIFRESPKLKVAMKNLVSDDTFWDKALEVGGYGFLVTFVLFLGGLAYFTGKYCGSKGKKEEKRSNPRDLEANYEEEEEEDAEQLVSKAQLLRLSGTGPGNLNFSIFTNLIFFILFCTHHDRETQTVSI